MTASLTLFLPLKLSDTEAIVEAFKEEFDIQLKDVFSDDELIILEPKLDALGAVFVQPILSELTFDDFYAAADKEDLQRDFFMSCRSSIAIENMPYLETNPVQVTYLKDLVGKFPEILIDRGGVSEILFKNDFLGTLTSYKDMLSLAGGEKIPVKIVRSSSVPVDPIDFLIRDVYKEFDRLKDQEIDGRALSPKLHKIFTVMKNENTFDSSELLRRTSLNAKDFDDGLESLKFWLRKK